MSGVPGVRTPDALRDRRTECLLKTDSFSSTRAFTVGAISAVPTSHGWPGVRVPLVPPDRLANSDGGVGLISVHGNSVNVCKQRRLR